MTGVLIRGLRKPTSYQPQSSIMAKIRWGSGAFLVGVEKAVAVASMVASMVCHISLGVAESTPD